MKIYIVTGEKSGDQHASKIVKELKNLNNNIQFRAWGGNHLLSENVKLDENIDQINYMGFWEVFKNAFKVLDNLNRCKKNITDFSPDIVLLVDYPGFNLEVAKFTNRKNIRTYYYISPKIWAWRSSRIRKIKQYIDEMFVIFPFEKEYYKKRGYNVKYLGNPVLENILKNNFNLIKREKPIISLIPGSRKQEIEKILPIMLSVIDSYPDYHFIISASNSFSSEYYSKLVKGYNAEIIFDRHYDILASSFASIITSGTSTLEAALINVPQIVCYKTSSFSYLIAKLFVKIKYISLVNILLNKNSIIELIQNDLTIKNLELNLTKILSPIFRKNIFSDYKELKNYLYTKESVSGKIARDILESNYS